jgi:NAD-dependent deacetylase
VPHPERLRLGEDTRLLVLTGAGVSAESGIPTFRAAGGLWESHPVAQVASPVGFARDPALVWRFYSERRRKASACVPNPGHLALAALEARLGDRFLLATQNVDGLHGRAGSERLVELHGNLFLTRCSHCSAPPVADEAEHLGPELPRCPACASRGRDSLLRPHIVWFGEMLDPAHLQRVERFMARANLPGVCCTPLMEEAANPHRALARVAKERSADLVMVGRRSGSAPRVSAGLLWECTLPLVQVLLPGAGDGLRGLLRRVFSHPEPKFN